MTPCQLFERPANLFVADFVGESNFFHGRLVVGGGEAHLDTGDMRIRVADGSARGGSRAAVVVRPERLQLLGPQSDVAAGWNVVDATVTTVIYLGNAWKYDLLLAESSRHMVARVPPGPGRLTAGDYVRAAWPPEAGVVVEVDRTEEDEEDKDAGK